MDISAIVEGIGDGFHDGVVILGAATDPCDPCILWCNDGLGTQFIRDPGALIGQPLSLLYAGSGGGANRDGLRAGLRGDDRFRLNLLCTRNGGEEFWCEFSFSPVPRPDGGRAWIGFLRDIGDLMRLTNRLSEARESARRARQRLIDALEALPDGFVMYDSDDRLVLCNERYRQIYDATGKIIRTGETFRDILRRGIENGQYPDAAGREDAWLEERMERHLNPTGPVIQELPGNRFLKIHEVRTPGGDIVGVRADVTELQRKRQKLTVRTEALSRALDDLETVSRSDALTGLGNRRGLDMAIDAACAEAEDADEVALLHIDLDRFKPINDVFGHAAGDFILQHVARVLRGCVRGEDYVARVGGDEFVVLLPGRAGTDTETAATVIAERIIRDCSQPVKWKDKVLHFGTSVGIATGPVAQARRLIQNADIALYSAKEQGRNRAALFTPELRRAAEERKRIGDAFLEALAGDEIVAYFQPQVDAASGRLSGVEALVRWQHPRRGVIGPDDFLPVARDLGLLADVDQRVLEFSNRMARDCAAAGLHLPKLSVNISYPRLQVLRDRSAIPGRADWPCPVSFELLETIDFDMDDNHLVWILDQIRDMGIGIELDDFGSGRASLTSLLKIRPDRIKIDRRIVSAVFSPNLAATAMIRAIGEMARSLGISMTAEGIETPEQASFMRALGVETLQGFLYGRPMPRAELLRRLADDPTGQTPWRLEEGRADMADPADPIDAATAVRKG